MPWCTFTDPELARVGLSETEAKRAQASRTASTASRSTTSTARAPKARPRASPSSSPIPKGKLLGAAIVGPHAGELIAEYVLALTKGLNAKDLSGVDPHLSDARASISRRVADQRLKEGLTPTAKTWIKRIFGLQGA